MALRFAFLLIILGAAGCAAPFGERVERLELPKNLDLRILSFDNKARCTNLPELERIAEDIVRDEVENVVVVSMGWDYAREQAHELYSFFIQSYQARLESLAEDGELPADSVLRKRTMFIGVAWDSRSLGIRTLLTDSYPMPTYMDAIAYVPDRLLLLLTFWAKADLADRIGYRDLRRGLNLIYKKVEEAGAEPPKLSFVGHSFGARVLTAALDDDDDEERKKENRDAHFNYLDEVHSAIFLQPALNEILLPSGVGTFTKFSGEAEDGGEETAFFYPVFVTQCRLDYANSFLFPLGNTVFNTAVIQVSNSSFRDIPLDVGWISEILFAPLLFGLTIVTDLLELVTTPLARFLHRPYHTVPDTLAQIPFVKIPFVLFDRGVLEPLGAGAGWGARGRGLVALNLTESAGRVTKPSNEVHDYRALFEGDRLTSKGREVLAKLLPVYVDMTSIYERSLWRELFVDWIDPVGTHNGIDRPEYFQLIDRVLAR